MSKELDEALDYILIRHMYDHTRGDKQGDFFHLQRMVELLIDLEIL